MIYYLIALDIASIAIAVAFFNRPTPTGRVADIDEADIDGRVQLLEAELRSRVYNTGRRFRLVDEYDSRTGLPKAWRDAVVIYSEFDPTRFRCWVSDHTDDPASYGVVVEPRLEWVSAAEASRAETDERRRQGT